MKNSHTQIARWKLWQLAFTILLAFTVASNVLAAPLDASFDSSLDSIAQSTYNLTVSTVGSGSVTREPEQSAYLAGTFVNLTATAATGFTFTGWDGGCQGTGVCTVTMGSDANVTATFALISASPNDAPSLTSAPVLSATAGVHYTYFVMATDPDADDVMTLSASVKPAWLTLVPTGNGTAILTGTPGSANLGAHIVRLHVQDGAGAFATQEYILIVDAPASEATGSIQGMVVDAGGNGISGATVTRVSGNSEVMSTSAQNQITNSSGSYHFDAVPAGDYTIAVSLNDQAPDALLTVTVLPGEVAEIPAVTLQVELQVLHLPLLYK